MRQYRQSKQLNLDLGGTGTRLAIAIDCKGNRTPSDIPQGTSPLVGAVTLAGGGSLVSRTKQHTRSPSDQSIPIMLRVPFGWAR